MRIGRIGADHDDDVGAINRLEVLRACRSSISLRQSEPGRRMADTRAGVDVVVAEAGAHQLLDQEHFLVRAARRRDGANRIATVLTLDPLEFARRVLKRLIPRDFPPGIVDALADHRPEDAVLVRRIAVSEASLDARMALVRLASLIGDHAQDFIAFQFRLEGAADPAVGACRHHAALGRALVDDRFFVERRGRTGLHAGAARDTFGREEVAAAGSDLRIETATENSKREGALHLLAGAHAAGTDDALRGFEGEIGVGPVGRRLQVIGAVVAVAHVAKADVARLCLQLAVAVGAAGQTVERMVRDVELHHASSQPLQPGRPGMHDHALFCRRRAGSGRAFAALDLDETEATGAEGLEIVGCAELRDQIVDQCGGGHHRGPGRNADLSAVDGQRDVRLSGPDGRARVEFLQQRHSWISYSAAARGGALAKSSLK